MHDKRPYHVVVISFERHPENGPGDLPAPSVPGAVVAPARLRARPPLAGQPPVRTAAGLASYLRKLGADPELVEATGTWMISGRRASARTRQAYAQDLSRWVKFCVLRGVHPAQAGPAVADLYAGALRELGLADSTVARRLAVVSSWYRYLHGRARLTAGNPLDGMDRPRVGDDTATRGLSRAELARLLAHARAHESPRTFALLMLLVATAGRVGSILRATVGNLGYDSGHQVIDLTVKGGATRRFALPPAVNDALDTYLGDRGPVGADAPLFATTTGRPLDQPSVYRLLQRVARARRHPAREPAGPALDPPVDGHPRPQRGRPVARGAGLPRPRRPPHHPPVRSRPQPARAHPRLPAARDPDGRHARRGRRRWRRSAAGERRCPISRGSRGLATSPTEVHPDGTDPLESQDAFTYCC